MAGADVIRAAVTADLRPGEGRTMTTIELAPEDEAEVEEFAGTLFMAALAAMELATSSSASGSGSTKPWRGTTG